MSECFPKAFERFGVDISVKLDLSHYASKADLKEVTRVDTSNLASLSGLASLQAEVDKVDIDK